MRPVSDLEQRVCAIERPHRKLLHYYLIRSLLLGPLFFLIFIPLSFRFRTLRYRFDPEGISMRWGVLFRREINLTYARIQDIHLRSGIIERHLGLARIEVQTASGSAKAEMTIEGLLEFEEVRDYLYLQMRGVGEKAGAARAAGAESAPELANVLRDVTSELRGLREDLRSKDGPA
jgi:membrane protein YdbS with pleckstrin-like domain